MSTVVTELIVRADGALQVLDRFEKGMEDAGRASERSTGAVAQFEAVSAKLAAQQSKGLAISTQKVERISREQRAWEKLAGSVDRATGLEIRLRREAQRAAIDAANAVVFGIAKQEQALQTLVNLERQHAAQLDAAANAALEQASAMNMSTAATDKATAALKRHGSANDNASKHRKQNLGYQLFDIGQGAAGGLPVGMIAAQQLPQIIQLYAGQGGLKSALKDVGSIAAGVVSTFGAVPLAIAAAGAAALLYFTATAENTKSVDELLKQHADTISALGDAYGIAVKGAKEYSAEQQAVAKASASTDLEDLKKGQIEAARELRSQFGEFAGRSGAGSYKFVGDYKEFTSAFDILSRGIRTGTDVSKEFIHEVQRIKEANPEYDTFANKILVASQQFVNLSAAAAQTLGILTKIGSIEFVALDPLGTLAVDVNAVANRTPSLFQQQQNQIKAFNLQLNAKSPKEKGDAAAAQAAAQFNSSEGSTARYYRIETARIESQTTAQNAFTDSLKQRNMEQQKGLKLADYEHSILGKSAKETNGLLQAKKLELDMRADYAANNVPADEAAIKAATDLEKKTADLTYQNQQATKSAGASSHAYRDLAKDAQDRIDQLQLETDALGRTGVEADKYRFRLDLIQKATDKGRALTKPQIDDIDRLTDAYGKNAEALAFATAHTDILEQRKTIGMSEDQLRIYERVKDSGLKINSEKGKQLAADEKINIELEKQQQQYEGIVDTLASSLADIFTEPTKNLNKFLDDVTSGFADLGKSALKDGFKSMLSGNGLPGMSGLFGGAANDNDPLASLGKTVEDAAAKGTQAGAEDGFGGMFKGLLSPKNMKMAGAGLGGFGMGYQSQSPLMGALGGALSGFMTAGPIGGVIGGIAGLIGGWLGGNSESKKAKKEAGNSISDSLDAIKSFIDQGMGRGAGVYRPQYVEYATQANKYIRTAKKAGNKGLANEIEDAKVAYKKLLQTDFKLAFGGTIKAMNTGLGANSPFMQAQQGIVGLRDELKNFIADTKWTGSNLNTARSAARAYALSVLTGAKELSPMEAEMQKVHGTAAGLQNTLTQLGMSSKAAGDAINKGIATAIAKLRKQYTDDLGKSINELSGKGYLNEMKDAGDVFTTRHKDAQALGLSDSLAYRELGLKLADIASQSDLTAAQLVKYAKALHLPTAAINIALKELPIAEAKQWASTLEDLKTRLLVATTNTDTLAGALKVFDRQQSVERIRMKEQGATAAVMIALDKAVAAERLNIIADFNRRTIETTKSALDEAMQSFKAFADGIKDFRDSMKLNASYSTLSAGGQLDEAKKQYEDLLAKANGGDRDAMSKLTGASQAYLDQAKNFYGSSEAYAKIFDTVDISLKKAGDYATQQVTAAEKQIDLLSKQVASLKAVNDSVLTVAQLTKKLTDAVMVYHAKGGKGFASGGYTGDYGVTQVSGVVHGREYVMPAQQTARYRADLEDMRAGRYTPAVVNRVVSEPVLQTSSNDDGWREAVKVMAQGFTKTIETLREEHAQDREETRRAVNEQRIATDRLAKSLTRNSIFNFLA